MWRRPAGFAFVCLSCWLSGSGASWAGIGPENVAVVVNADSWASLTVANEFVHLRGIPPSNVVYLDGLPDHEQASVEAFRESILKPVLKTLAERGLTAQIDCIAYSSDLPHAVDVRADLEPLPQKPPQVFTPTASLNGLTYLYQQVLARDANYLQLNSNRYVRLPIGIAGAKPLTAEDGEQYRSALALLADKKWAEAGEILASLAAKHPQQPQFHYNLACCLARQDKPDEALAALTAAAKAGWANRQHAEQDEDLKPLRDRKEFQDVLANMVPPLLDTQPTLGFRSAYRWNAQGERRAADGRGYLLSTLLAVTSGRGTSVAEAVAALRRSAAADGSRPAGTVYFVKNGDIRSRTREPLFASAAAQLRALQVNAEIIDGVLPIGKPDVAGAVIGAAGFNWAASRSTILPGAICEHLTSFGGVMRDGAGQTPLSEFLRHGAAGSSGTVTEPYAIQAKFPLPFLHVHYARGCTLAEAFYQSVAGPYQLLIVGDPLCRPWAKIPQVEVRGLKAGDVVQGELTLQPAVKGDVAIARFELFLDGRRTAMCNSGETLRLDAGSLSGGWHEARIVAIAADAVESQGRAVMGFRVDRPGRRVELTVADAERAIGDQPLRVTADVPGANSISIVHNAREVALINGERGAASLDPLQLGFGRITLHAAAEFEDDTVWSRPVAVDIAPPSFLPAAKTDAQTELEDGLLLAAANGLRRIVANTRDQNWLSSLKLPPGTAFTLEADFDVPRDDVYQFQLNGNCAAQILVNDRPLGAPQTTGWAYRPAALARGRHALRIAGTIAENPRLQIHFGGAGTQSLDGKRFRHAALGPAAAARPW